MADSRTEEERAYRAAQNGAGTIYAQLMEFANAEPRRLLYKRLKGEVERFAGDFGELMAEELKRAYVAGVADGYRDAVIRSEQDA